MAYVLLILGILSLLLGPILLHFADTKPSYLRFLDSFVLVSVFGLVVFHILPEGMEIAGLWAGVAAACGLFGPMLLSSYLKTGECHIHRSMMSLASLGLVAHAVMDGAAIASAAIDFATNGMFLATAIILHRLPEGIAVWRIAKTGYGLRVAITALFVLIVAVIAGFYFGEELFKHSSEKTLIIFQSIMAGALLHVIFHRHHLGEAGEEAHHHCEGKEHRHRWHKSSGLGVLAGILVVGTLLLIHPEHHAHSHDHAHEHCDHEHDD